MLILGIETSTRRSSVALVDSGAVVASAALGVPRRHGEFLAPGIRFCLHQAGRDVGDLTGVAVGIGPGGYTGLRVGIVTAASIAAARSLPVVGISGLDVLAFQARHTRRRVCAAIDAGRGEVFWAFYSTVPGGVQRETEPAVGRPEALAAEITSAGRECLVLGDGGMAHRRALTSDDAEVDPVANPDAADLAHLSVGRFEREETCRADELAPIYLRKVDARIGWQTRGRLRGGAHPEPAPGQ